MNDRQPPYQADTRSRGWRFEIDMERVRRSDTWSLAAPEVRPWLLMMWTVSWEEVPCGSLPNDDEVIAAKLGMPLKLFSKHARILRRGWWLASDGRLYHDTIADRVVNMLDKRVKDAKRAQDARDRKAAAQANHAGITRDERVSSDGVQVEFDTLNPEPSSKENPPTPQGGTPAKPGRVRVGNFPPGFERFWAAYPRKIGKDAAAKAFARLRADDALLSRILAALEAQRLWPQWVKDGGVFIPHAATWINGRRWEDEEASVSARVDPFAGAA